MVKHIVSLSNERVISSPFTRRQLKFIIFDAHMGNKREVDRNRDRKKDNRVDLSISSKEMSYGALFTRISAL